MKSLRSLIVPITIWMFPLLILLSTCSVLHAENNISFIFELDITRTGFNDQVVAGHALNPAFGLALSYNSRIEIGYTEMIALFDASMSENAGVKSEDGFYAEGKLFYLRGYMPVNDDVAFFAQIGRSEYMIEATSTYGCFFLCGDVLVTSTDTDYRHEGTGLAIGAGVSFRIDETRRLVIQYVDYDYNSDFGFKVITLGYRRQYSIPI